MNKFLKRCAEVMGEIERFAEPIVVGHYDADGLSATAATSMGLQKMGKTHSIVTLRKLSEKEFEKVEKGREYIFVDFGGAYQETVELLGGKAVIIDHHQAQEGRILQANPHLFGIDGGTEISAAGVAYYVFHHYERENNMCELEQEKFDELADLAIVGASGDMQIPLKGINREILREGIQNKRLRCDIDLQLFGRVSRPLPFFLCYATEPFLPNLTGNSKKCMGFIKDLGIPLKSGTNWRTYDDLSFEEKQKLVTALIIWLSDSGASEREIKSLIGEVYTLIQQPPGTELRDAREFSTLLNACGRHWKPEIGIAVCMGDPGAYKKASNLLALHRRKLREGVEYAASTLQEREKFYYLDGRGVIEDGLIGVIAGMLYKRNKPVIGIAFDEHGEIKVSGRGTRDLLRAGLNLGELLHKATEGIGEGGGHKIAAGATIKKEALDEFLKRVNDLL